MATARAKADHATAILEGLADRWAEEVRLVDMIKLCSHVTRNLRQSAPDEVREHFIGRQEAQIDAIVRQAFMEGAYRVITGLQDERKAIAALRRKRGA